MKKIFTLILTLCSLSLWAYDFEVDGIYYNILADKTNEVEVTNGPSRYTGSVTIPYTVTYNGITYSVTSIGDGAFGYCSGLTSVTIGNSVTSIGELAFCGCDQLEYITLPNTVTSIGNHAFWGCSGLTSIEIPNSVMSIGDGAFARCSGLTYIEIPNSVTSIGYAAFSGCSGLTSIVVEEGNSIYDSRENCNAIIETNSNTLVAGCKNTTIPNSVTSIGDYAFSNCSSLTSITIPNSVTSIGDGAFRYCSGLTSITIPNSVTSIGDYALEGCSGLTSITIPNSVTSIGGYAFAWCESLTSITIPNSVTSIGDGAFGYCSGLTSITIPNSVTSIGEYAFESCSGLTSITIPNSVTSIGEGAFYGCSGLTSIVVEEGNSIYDSRENCNAIIETNSNTLVAGCKNTTIPNSVTSIGWGAFGSCSSLTSITIPNSVTSIGEAAFQHCSGLTSIEIPNSVTSIGDYAFSHCSGLTSITIPNSVTSIGDRAFNNCSGLTSVTIPNSVTSIGDYAFYECTGLTSITIPNSVIDIGEEAFAYCSELATVTSLATTPPVLGEEAFLYCNDPVLFVLCESQADYQSHEQWGQFSSVQCIASEEVETDDVVINTGSTSVTITWPTEENAYHYVIEIKKDDEVFCTLTFNADGQLLNIAFAPGRSGSHPVTYAASTGNGLRFTVTSLEEGTTYGYDITTKDEEDNTLSTYTGEFTTKGNVSTSVSDTQSPITNCQKLLRNGQLIILRDGKTYTTMGAEIQ